MRVPCLLGGHLLIQLLLLRSDCLLPKQLLLLTEEVRALQEVKSLFLHYVLDQCHIGVLPLQPKFLQQSLIEGLMSLTYRLLILIFLLLGELILVKKGGEFGELLLRGDHGGGSLSIKTLAFVSLVHLPLFIQSPFQNVLIL